MIQGQFCSQVTASDLDLATVETQVSSQDNSTLRELILEFKKKEKRPLFVGVERKWNRQGYCVLYPKVYMEEAMEKIKHLPYYLVKEYGEGIKKCFGPETQRVIATTVWNDEEQRAVSEEDAELLEAETAHSTMPWFTFSPKAEKELTLNQKTDSIETLEARDKVNIDIDQYSAVSTFATTTKNQENRFVTSPEAKDLRDDVSVFTNTS